MNYTMANISGRIVFDRDRSATITSGDSGISNIPVVLQNITTNVRLTVPVSYTHLDVYKRQIQKQLNYFFICGLRF